jgi:hypothetical protein
MADDMHLTPERQEAARGDLYSNQWLEQPAAELQADTKVHEVTNSPWGGSDASV